MNSTTLRRIFCLVAAVAALAATAADAAAQTPASIYTSLGAKQCKTVRIDKESGSSTQVCPGVGGYRLQVEDSDSRQSITVIDPQGGRHELNYWHVVTSGFSSLGDKAEWRVIRSRGKVTPVALIVRVNASEDAERPQNITSYLSVTRLTPQRICVTDKISPGAAQNEAARRAADTARSRPCLQ